MSNFDQRLKRLEDRRGGNAPTVQAAFFADANALREGSYAHILAGGRAMGPEFGPLPRGVPWKAYLGFDMEAV